MNLFEYNELVALIKSHGNRIEMKDDSVRYELNLTGAHQAVLELKDELPKVTLYEEVFFADDMSDVDWANHALATGIRITGDSVEVEYDDDDFASALEFTAEWLADGGDVNTDPLIPHKILLDGVDHAE